MTMWCSPAWFARCDTAASKMSSMSSEFKVSLMVPSSKCVMVSRFSTMSMSQSESWYTSSSNARRCSGARRPESSRRIAAAPRNRRERRTEVMAERAQQICSELLVARKHGSLFMLARLPFGEFERALADDRTSDGELNESISRSAARIPTTPNASSCVRTGRNMPSPMGMETISEASADTGGAEASESAAEAAPSEGLADRNARNASTRAFLAVAARIAAIVPIAHQRRFEAVPLSGVKRYRGIKGASRADSKLSVQCFRDHPP